MKQQRTTVIVVQPNKQVRDWNLNRAAAPQLAFLTSLDSLKFAIYASVDDTSSLDLGRIIIDRAASADDLLELLAALPAAFNGDILFINDEGGGYLSAAARGGDRVIYQLQANDVRFYLETHDLVTGRTAAPPAVRIFEATA
jgi:hypothetical protein